MPGSSSWIPYAQQGVKGFDDYDDDRCVTKLKMRQVIRHRHLIAEARAQSQASKCEVHGEQSGTD